MTFLETACVFVIMAILSAFAVTVYNYQPVANGGQKERDRLECLNVRGPNGEYVSFMGCMTRKGY